MQIPRDCRRRTNGFTLLETLIVGAIIAILVMVAFPSYQDQMRKSRRASAEALLMDIATRQQQYLFDRRIYAADLATLNVVTPSDVASFYTISIDVQPGPPPSFTVTATPTGAQVKDLGGTALTIDNSGAKTPGGAW
jgi:type IV pilus assembly protein PilE